MAAIFWILRLFAGLLILLITVIIIGYIGLASAMFLVSDGLERFSGRDLEFAREALVMAHIGCADHPIQRAMMWKLKVVEVKFDPQCQHKNWPFSVDYDYRAVVRTYTLFGIPTGKITTDCGETVCNTVLTSLLLR